MVPDEVIAFGQEVEASVRAAIGDELIGVIGVTHLTVTR